MSVPEHPLRVMQLILGLQVGGLETMVVRLCQGLDRSRFQPLVCCMDELGPLAQTLEQSGIQVHLLQRQPGTDWGYARRLAALLKQQRVDVLHLHNPTAWFYGSLGGRLAGIKPIIYTEHGRDYSSGWKSRMLHHLLARLVHRVVVLHDRARVYLHQHEGVPLKRIVKVHNGIEPPATTPAEQKLARRRIRDQLGLDDDVKLVAIVARLDPIKNIPCLLEAMARVRQTQPSAQLLVVGDGPLRAELKQQTAALDLQSAVHFLGTRHDVPNLLAASDLLVLPSFSEGLSMTLIEGSAAGLPLVASDVGGNGELAVDGVNGLLVPVDDHAALATALGRIIADPDWAATLGQAGRQRFERYFQAATMIARYQSLYLQQAAPPSDAPETD